MFTNWMGSQIIIPHLISSLQSDINRFAWKLVTYICFEKCQIYCLISNCPLPFVLYDEINNEEEQTSKAFDVKKVNHINNWGTTLRSTWLLTLTASNMVAIVCQPTLVTGKNMCYLKIVAVCYNLWWAFHYMAQICLNFNNAFENLTHVVLWLSQITESLYGTLIFYGFVDNKYVRYGWYLRTNRKPFGKLQKFPMSLKGISVIESFFGRITATHDALEIKIRDKFNFFFWINSLY